MATKRNEGKFTLQFNQDDPVHCKAIEKLNSLPRNKKANYLALTIAYFEDSNKPLADNEINQIKKLLSWALKEIVTEHSTDFFIPTADNVELIKMPEVIQNKDFTDESQSAIFDALDMFNI